MRIFVLLIRIINLDGTRLSKIYCMLSINYIIVGSFDEIVDVNTSLISNFERCFSLYINKS